ncbi:MAG TPA: GTP-binding protein [Ohtaekwangia sp.]|nr:GTP-binding protein [Ohtaekwangia sp.]
MKLALIGGFLGSGKTTSIIEACTQLIGQGTRVGVVTNDQGDLQVDESFLRHSGIRTLAVSNGCFCCNYSQLDTQIAVLQNSISPDIIFAESVGSCTDLVATIAKPFCLKNPAVEVVISIFADAALLLAMIENRSSLTDESLRYIYRKQLEEADLLVINKADLLRSDEQLKVHRFVQQQYPEKIILLQSAWRATDISHWLEMTNRFVLAAGRRSLDIDYDRYAEGEAKLAWHDQQIEISAPQKNAVWITSRLIGSIFDSIQESRLTIGHLKFFIATDEGADKVSFTTGSTSATIRLQLSERNTVRLAINARVQSNPQQLTVIVEDAIMKSRQRYGCHISFGPSTSFSPAYPRPQHRL